MLVVISDLHLTDNSNGIGLDPGAMEMFAPRLAELAARASWRSDGRYQPLERIDLVLLGDILDMTRSRRWFAGSVRPWSDVSHPQLLETSLDIAEDIIQANDTTLSMLRAIGTEGAIRVPQASSAGAPLLNYDTQSIPVAIHYMVGNSDWMLHIRGHNFDLLRQRVCHAMGLMNNHREAFPHDAAESDELLDTLREHSMLARHGDIFDPLHCGEDRDASSIGEAIAIEVIQRFQCEMEAEYAAELSPAILNALRELDHFRPLTLAAVFLESLLERCGLRPTLVKDIKRTWDRLVEAMLQLPAVSSRGGLCPADITDQLANSLLFSRKVSLGWATNIRAFMRSLRGATSDSYYQHALAEADCRNRRARHIVYGHTHRSEIVPLDASYADGYVLQQTYFNAGAWRRGYEQTHSVAGEHEFMAADSFTFHTFFRDNERGGRPYESWTGSLGTNALSFASQVAPTAKASRTAAPVPRPHFMQSATTANHVRY